MIAEKLRWKEGREEGVEGLKAAALLHDIGKLAIPEYILNKPSGLTKWEVQKMQTHSAVGAEILETVPFPYEVVPYVRHHHEKWDGTGYPDGLKGNDIPLGARILSVADCYDALRSDRPYRAAMSSEVALEYITGLARKSYDPVVVAALVENIDEFESKLAESEAAKPVRTETFTSSPWEPAPDADIAKTVFHDIASAHRETQAVYEISESVAGCSCRQQCHRLRRDTGRRLYGCPDGLAQTAPLSVFRAQELRRAGRGLLSSHPCLCHKLSEPLKSSSWAWSENAPIPPSSYLINGP